MTGPAKIAADRLLRFAEKIYAGCGMSAGDAHVAADTLVHADLWGHQSHGFMRLSWYEARLKAGACDPRGRPEAVVDAGAIAVLDGREAMGQVVAHAAMGMAIARAKAHGIGAVSVRNSNHFGTAMYFTRAAADAGCIGFLSTNASPAMAPWGGKRKMVGTNPWSWAAPAGKHAHLVLDIANTAVARGKIYLARQKGLAIPPDWALTADGEPTTDPVLAIDGILQPMAGHKGYAIAVVMDMLSGVLSGSEFGANIQGPYQAKKRSGAGHLALAFDISKFQPPDQFGKRMETLIADLKATPRAAGAAEILYPGELEARNEAEHRRHGIALPENTRADLDRLAEAHGIEKIGAA
ncbi:MAG: Ldh family oxidoreductase [Proteobacteria bacterium]|nr:Ldh family oxidoreductase [Pseudomonadota bacterium]